MNCKLSNIGKWILGLLALVTVGLGIYFYLGLTDNGRTNLILNWGYILILLGVVVAVISALIAIIVAIMRGVPRNKVISLGVVVAILIILAIVAKVISKDLIDTGLNFFYLTFGFSILAIVFSVIGKAVKK